ncbi:MULTISPECIES: NAD(P)-binding domain-containing protein [unclassified Lentimonas]|uniref:NAD(P)-binding domain-containing protein n=1 Tax=unclassified Lentimonas TaxID=2630993 RepID=UPI001328A2F3|nr:MULTISPECIES: NAD(P)-binding domain-containing protein [unclassified Lentimonas]CAA6678371.1 Thioredoxin reductase (EC [Lentimonas sp. CC4]CAA6685463.1 Thioredoxin reductase (EC [Lentimonas sp. CC6]CAA6690552.1 Thioredoxin reductase (EC [Lentimonas sp. CC10]CAA6695368.1 Thioredoxin reductase (EC [Lentimonas sp. CC19]CAA7068809.1 Thioredoxin reductase (EC [Lentimonas sp. CC11]
MPNLISRYTYWLHTKWPAGGIEKGPEVNEDGRTNVKGVRVVGDLTGVPLLKFSADTGAKAVAAILEESDFKAGAGTSANVYDLVIVGAGVSGMSAAIEAKKAGLNFVIYEADESFSTIHNFPRKKPIYTYPTEMKNAGELHFKADVKEDLLNELKAQQTAHEIETTRAKVQHISRNSGVLEVEFTEGESVKAQRVIVAIGRTGNFRKLNVPGETLDKVSNRLIDATELTGQNVMVVGGGDSALEAAVALVEAGAMVSLSYRKREFSRAKPENVERVQALADDGKLALYMGTNLKEINEDSVLVSGEDTVDSTVANDVVYTLIGREPPLDFFRKSKIPVTGDWTPKVWGSLIAFFIAFMVFYHWQKGLWLTQLSPGKMAWWVTSLGGLLQAQVDNPRNVLSHIRGAMNQPGFYYSLAYCICVVAFGIRRIKRRRTPYVKLQTLSLSLFQIIPLFLLPWILLPWFGALGWWESGVGGLIGDWFWPNGEYWRSFGLILAWPLFVYNWFTSEPLWGWLILGFIQTFVFIPFIVWKWGKGAYCGWICSCGALAETLGDAHRHKMPHGPFWNKFNMLGQVILAVAFVMMGFRIVGWVMPDGNFAAQIFNAILSGIPVLNWKYAVDVWLAGVFGVAFYFHFSGRVWCRFACPLAALMHIYARFSQYRIFAEKKKCISCNVCTTVCHQGIDVMNFANKGIPMEDPECVRCSACVQSCPTGVLSFGRFDGKGGVVYDSLQASPVRMQEIHELSPVDKYLNKKQ